MKVKNATPELLDHYSMEWQPIATAPYSVELELAVVDAAEIHTLVFPCRRVVHGWVNTKTGALTDVHPTHWREWQ